MSSGAYQLRLVRTLYQNVYGCMLYNENQQPVGQLEIVPNIPLDRSQVPEDAPEVYHRLAFDKNFPIGVLFDWRGVTCRA